MYADLYARQQAARTRASTLRGDLAREFAEALAANRGRRRAIRSTEAEIGDRFRADPRYAEVNQLEAEVAALEVELYREAKTVAYAPDGSERACAVFTTYEFNTQPWAVGYASGKAKMHAAALTTRGIPAAVRPTSEAGGFAVCACCPDWMWDALVRSISLREAATFYLAAGLNLKVLFACLSHDEIDRITHELRDSSSLPAGLQPQELTAAESRQITDSLRDGTARPRINPKFIG